MNHEPTSFRLDLPARQPFDAREEALLGDVDRALADGRTLKDWWQQREAISGYARPFELARTFNRPDRGLGFFDEVPLAGGVLPVLGVVQEMAFDRPKRETGVEVRDQLREFVLRYFMRVSDFREPEVLTDSRHRPEGRLSLSWCPSQQPQRIGFGYSQHLYKRCGSGEVGRFHRGEQYAIADLREVGTRYEWLVVKVRIFDFNLTFRPFGVDAFSVQVPLRAENYLVVSPEFVVCRDDPAPGVLGEYGFGYAFLRQTDEDGLLGYGPGHFEAGFQLFTFRLREDGSTSVRMAFVANRPRQILRVRFDPVDWAFWTADLFTFGLTSWLLAPARRAWARLAPRVGGVDPLTTSIAAANLLTGGQAAEQLCISREQLEQDFLAHHFRQHYRMIAGAALTWRQVPDWLDEAALPDFARTGVSS